MLYTGVRVAELVAIGLADVDLDACRIRITAGKGGKDRMVPFPTSFKEALALHIHHQRTIGATFLFESSWKKPYSHPWGPQAAGPLHHCGWHYRLDQPAPAAASTTRSSNPTPATSTASPWRSTPGSH